MTTHTIEAEVAGLGDGGDGRIDTPEGPLFVPFTVPGDVVRVDASGKVAAVVERLVDGPDRIEAACRHFETCGGCALQHVTPPVYAAWKRGRIERALAASGLEAAVGEPFVVAPGTRRRVRLAIDTRRGFGMGFRERRSHRIVRIEECPVAEPEIVALLPRLARSLPEKLRADISIMRLDGAIDVAVETGHRIELSAASSLAEFAARCDVARVTWSGDPVVTRAPVRARIGKFTVDLPPGAFVQPTAEGETLLRCLAGEALAGAERIADLYAGCGLLGLALAATARVDFFESAADQVGAIARAAPHNRADRRDLARQPLTPKELAGYDGALLDPPRAGALEQVRRLAESAVPVIAYASCNPATFARDTRILVDAGYRMGEVQPIDQFLYSPHVELFAAFRKP